MSKAEEKSDNQSGMKKDIPTTSLNDASSVLGGQIGPYKIISVLGEGGFGMVYVAEQLHPIKRLVALKVIKPGMDTKQVIARFETERQALAMLDHPNIANVYDAGTTKAGRPYFAMEYIKGIPITEYCDKYKLDIEKRLRLFTPICQAIQHSHQKGIIHRDIKPSNVLVTLHDSEPIPKIIDFGVAKALNQLLTEKTLFTAQGQLIGTPEYMSPEQAELTGLDVDTRTDIYSLGVLLYELLAGCTPFDPDELRSKGFAEMKHIICEQDPVKPSTKFTTLGGKAEDIAKHHNATVDQLRKSVKGDLDWIVMKCLEKDPRRRYGTAEALGIDIQHHLNNKPVLASPPSRLYRFGKLLRRNKVPLQAASVVVAILCIFGLLAAWYLHHEARIRWAKDELLPKIDNLINERKSKSDIFDAYRLALQAEKVIPNDPKLAEFFKECAVKMSITTEPQGATVYMKDYKSPEAPWEYVGVTPLNNIRFPLAVIRWKLEKQGYETVFAAASTQNNLVRVLDKKGTLPEGMVRVTVDNNTNSQHFPDFFIDTYEVSNRQFKEFVDAGGYQEQKYWKEPFDKEGMILSWEEAIKEFVDKTDQPGPATWQAGIYPSGQDQYPVSGVSWYEAAAYAEFVGKSIPTSDHWVLARGKGTAFVNTPALIAQLANFKGQGPAQIGSFQAMMPFGTYDMAGNVREWCWNQTQNGRAIRGGAWNDAVYMFGDISQLPPFDRSAKNGFRCVLLPNPENIPEKCFEVVAPATYPDFSNIPRVPDNEFKIYMQWFAYDKTPLDANVGSKKDASDWIQEKITLNAAYDNDKITAYIFLPKKSTPPYQTVIYFPGTGARQRINSTNLFWLIEFWDYIAPLIENGRAVLFPVYKGTFERNTDDVKNVTTRTKEIKGTVEESELYIKIVKDLKRCIDYLETRDDINKDALAYVGYSWGGRYGAMIPAIEDRLKASILILGGLCGRSLPAANEINYVRRVELPTLMLNGRYDTVFSYELSSKPMFDSLGTPPHKKKQIIYDTDHFVPPNEAVKETMDWLDRYLGPVK